MSAISIKLADVADCIAGIADIVNNQNDGLFNLAVGAVAELFFDIDEIVRSLGCPPENCRTNGGDDRYIAHMMRQYHGRH